ncbi:hypothetical protein Tco_0049991 [Tanacetum coccineum]
MNQVILKSHVEKPEKFKGSDFLDPYMVDGENVPTKAQIADYERAASQWNHNEYNCKNYILNALDDSMYDIYSTFATAREIWESLEKKYKTQVACSKKFIVGRTPNHCEASGRTPNHCP